MNALKMRAEALNSRMHATGTPVSCRYAEQDANWALWAAEKLGHVDPNAYADELVTEDIIKRGGAIERLNRDFAEAGIAVGAMKFSRACPPFLRQVSADMAACIFKSLTSEQRPGLKNPGLCV